MAKRGSGNTAPDQTPAPKPKSLKVAEKGVKTSHDFASLMSALMTDIIEGRVTPSIGNATCNAGGKLLKVVEMQYKYGAVGEGGRRKTLMLALEEGQSSGE